MTFGQIFALSIAILPTLSLAVTCYENWSEILKAIWVTDIKHMEWTGIPIHDPSPEIVVHLRPVAVAATAPASDHSSEMHDELSGMRSHSARRQTM
ncbi:uncharacterized protein EDB91DRAFT_1145931 [Suillus paluster]|uniref:uncharacterized protein n=1 Tax=Suillus paluster TaxID=48578 RepID=UPI001B866B3D|nr:uncharacterized protein EDB91DRAFT_1145931 [Suillus paluster]KAG1734896.1 hypothetical protein EDB91DRAFT_1145931 [Suillus paluster]